MVAAIPCRAEVKATCFHSISYALLEAADWWKKLHGPDAKFGLCVVERAHIVDARLAMLDAALESKTDYLWWIDDDMTIPEKCAQRLYENMKAQDAALSGALCYRRGEPYGPCAFTGKRHAVTGKPLQLHPKPERVAEVEATGFACLMMDVAKASAVHDLTGGAPFLYQKGTGEDAYYCGQARRLGHRIIVDTGLVPGHIGNINYDGKMFEQILLERPELAANMEPMGSPTEAELNQP